jgi:Protein of unknown function (DUF3761)
MKLKRLLSTFAFLASAAFAASAYAEAPAGSTGQCKDDTYTTAASKRGACAAHGGVKDWYGSKKATSKDSKAKTSTSSADASKTSTSSKAADSTTAAAAPPASTTKSVAAAPAATAKPATKSADMRTEAAPGGGAGKVWVNTKSKVYHCQGDEWYGKTKEGEYMSESAAKAAGAHADHGKACG